ncbi:helix-hairpin-helix domain-containing protein [Pedobacter sp. PLR]|uniref:helix-hairpin-helix domain-containing protein n=1 Tax=Pedobacter sp. PLR TaxID=2994465 RepID=UPI002245C885|nr:helix-hairpin-helix domain-containing protein [Pedobacter sp. PLR]MCX2450212.1 helix-hairpin-helix domain-containing protein [Pedobacter sp. PLR]
MSYSLFFCFILLLSYASLPASAQEAEQVKELRERLAENGKEEEDLSAFEEQLEVLRKNPIDLNHTNAEELKKLISLSPLQINSFFQHLLINGKLLDLLELQSISGFDQETITKIQPFVTLNPVSPYAVIKLKDLYREAEQQLLWRYGRTLEQQKGFRDLPGSRYLGSADKLLLSYKYQYPKIGSISLLMKKDAGETLGSGTIPVDFLSGNIALFNYRRIQKLIIGDYTLQFGQGLSLWSGFSLGKGPDVTSVASKDLSLKPYTSSNESAFFRGIASTIQLPAKLYLTPFYSFRKRDASLKSGTDGELSLTTISESGLHRTASEIRNRKQLSQQVYGATLQYLSNPLNLGFSAYHSQYDQTFTREPTTYKKYNFEGRRLSNFGLHYNTSFQNIYFYGELAKANPGGWAGLQGAMTSLSKSVSMVLLYRKYDKDYHSFFSQAIGENTETSNEKGLYLGLNYLPGSHWKFALYLDYFKFPEKKYRVDTASSGYEALAQLVYTPSKQLKITARFKTERKQQNPTAKNTIRSLDKVLKSSFRFDCNWKLNRKFNSQQRVELIQYQQGSQLKEFGYLIYQDLDYTPMHSKISGNIRLAYFNTPSYQSRIYAYEADVLYGSGSGGYYGQGIRTFLNLRYRLLKKLDIWSRYALYYYPHLKLISSGLDEINGNKKSELKLLIRHQF